MNWTSYFSRKTESSLLLDERKCTFIIIHKRHEWHSEESIDRSKPRAAQREFGLATQPDLRTYAFQYSCHRFMTSSNTEMYEHLISVRIPSTYMLVLIHWGVTRATELRPRPVTSKSTFEMDLKCDPANLTMPVVVKASLLIANYVNIVFISTFY